MFKTSSTKEAFKPFRLGGIPGGGLIILLSVLLTTHAAAGPQVGAHGVNHEPEGLKKSTLAAPSNTTAPSQPSLNQSDSDGTKKKKAPMVGHKKVVAIEKGGAGSPEKSLAPSPRKSIQKAPLTGFKKGITTTDGPITAKRTGTAVTPEIKAPLEGEKTTASVSTGEAHPEKIKKQKQKQKPKAPMVSEKNVVEIKREKTEKKKKEQPGNSSYANSLEAQEKRNSRTNR